MAKVLIDIPEQYLKLIHSDSPINWVSMSGFLNFVRNGIVLGGLTNGEVMQKMFPEAEVNCTERLQTAGLPRRDADFDLDFWNRKWGETE